MNLHLSKLQTPVSGEIFVTGSKSESNRLLILQALYPEVAINNLSESDDTKALQKALTSTDETVDIHHAGTAMRFLTAYFASQEGKRVILTGSERMQERPVELLVNALRSLGADIEYAKKKGFPPLIINGKKLTEDRVVLKANISSQYISALMLIAPSLPNGLEITLLGQVTSGPYIEMTTALLKQAGIDVSFQKQKISIQPKKQLGPVSFTVESDWSSASYFYSILALSEGGEIALSSYKEISTQGDSVLMDIYEQFGIQTRFEKDKLILSKADNKKPKSIILNLMDSPDIAQTIAVTCFGLGMECELSGLHTLRIKETNRLQALNTEIEKLGGRVAITTNSLKVFPTKSFRENVSISTYNDHRMAMAFAPLALKMPLRIEDAGVVTKSYPNFWEDLKTLGFQISQD